VLSKSQILDHVWHYDFGGDGNVVETYVSYLRKKLEKYGPPLIHTIRLVGYTLREPESERGSLSVAAAPPPARGRALSRSPRWWWLISPPISALHSSLYNQVNQALMAQPGQGFGPGGGVPFAQRNLNAHRCQGSGFPGQLISSDYVAQVAVGSSPTANDCPAIVGGRTRIARSCPPRSPASRRSPTGPRWPTSRRDR
jgi:hypothetical protein